MLRQKVYIDNMKRIIPYEIQNVFIINCYVVYHWEEINKKFPLPLRVGINRTPKTDR